MVLTFGDLCNLLEGVEKISTRRPRYAPEREEEQIQRHVAKWFDEHREELDDSEAPSAALLSAVFPHKRKDRVYGLQPPLLSKKISKLMNFNHGQMTVFEGWKQGHLGDLGRYAELTYKPWDGTFKSYTKSLIPMQRIDNLLTQLAAKYRFSDPGIRKQRDWSTSTDTELRYVLSRIQSWEVKWFVRLLLREYTTISLNETYVFRQYHFLLPDILKFQDDFDAAFRMLRGELSHLPAHPAPSSEVAMRLEAARLLKPVVGVKVARPTFYKAWSFKNCLQLVGNRAWAAEVKYDGEYCEIHVNLETPSNDIKIFSKNGKDATNDREALRQTTRNALRIGQPGCAVKRNCILLAEMVLYSDQEQKILTFSKIRKHVKRSGTLLGTLQDSLPHAWEHLALVFFDVLVLDDKPVMRQCLQKRRGVLRELVQAIPGRSLRSQWTLLDFKNEFGVIDLKQSFARSLAHRQEGLVLKPLGVPYFPLYSNTSANQPGYFIKLKKDYLGDMGGQRDLGDFSIIGASFDPQSAPKTDVKPLHWTHFYIGCVTNMSAVQRSGAKPTFKVVGCLSLDKQISKGDLKYLNQHGRLQEVDLGGGRSTDAFDIERQVGYTRRIAVAFKNPFVVEILGGGYEKVQDETFEMLRHPRVRKVHQDRTWEDTVTMDDLKRMAEEKWEMPDAEELNGHARDVALLAEKYLKKINESQASHSECGTTQETTQRSEASTTAPAPTPTKSAEVQESQEATYTTIESSQGSGSTQGNGIRASRQTRQILVRQDTTEHIRGQHRETVYPTPPTSSGVSTGTRRSPTDDVVSPPSSKRRRMRTPLADAGVNRNFGSFDYDSQEKVIHIYAADGVGVQVHPTPRIDEEKF